MLDQAELIALKTFAISNGHRWKAELRNQWEHASCSPELMRVRNKIGPSGLATIRQSELNVKLPPTPRKEFEMRTAIMPDVIAWTCIRQTSVKTDQAQWFADHVDRWVRWFHANDSTWRRILNGRGDAGRDRVYTFIKHWLTAYAKDPERYQAEHPMEMFDITPA